MKRGIDVSTWQGNIDWDSVKNSGVEFAIVRAGYVRNGVFTEDKEFKHNMENCTIPHGVYVYVYGNGYKLGLKPFEDLRKLLDEYAPFDYPVYIDLEDVYSTGAVDYCVSALEYIEKAGYFAGFYTYYHFLKEMKSADYNKIVGRYTLWLAAYWDTRPADVPHDMWQYSSSNALDVPMFGTALDCNMCYEDFPAVIKSKGLNGYAKPIRKAAIFIPELTGEDIDYIKNALDARYIKYNEEALT